MAELHTQVWNRPDCPHTKRHWYAGGLHIRPLEKQNRLSVASTRRRAGVVAYYAIVQPQNAVCKLLVMALVAVQ